VLVLNSKDSFGLYDPLALVHTKSIARVAAPPSTKISVRLNDLVGINSCQHSLEIETIIVSIKESNRMPPGKAFLRLERNDL